METDTLLRDASDITHDAYAAIWRAHNHAMRPEDTTTRRLLSVALVNMERTVDALRDATIREHDDREQNT